MLIENFIGIYDDFCTPEECQELITLFEQTKEMGLTFSRQQVNDMEGHQKNDESIFLMEQTNHIPNLTPLMKNFTNNFWEKVYKPYIEQYSVLKFMNQTGIISIKLQKTKPTQGYHVWHFEDGSQRTKGRILTFMVYLNNVEEGGETEFLYLSKRIKPKQGCCLLWPAGFTHTHRGNPPLSGDKYILTGWTEWTTE